MPQPVGSFGGQRGTGIALVLAAETAAWALEPLEVVAIAPVSARQTTKLRTMIFMMKLPLGNSAAPGLNRKILWTRQMEQL